MSFKLLEALEGGARSAGRQTLGSDAKPMTEVPSAKLFKAFTFHHHSSAEDKPKFSCQMKFSTHVEIKLEKLKSSWKGNQERGGKQFQREDLKGFDNIISQTTGSIAPGPRGDASWGNNVLGLMSFLGPDAGNDYSN
ncbi:hypothetical protein BOTCAL_0181g00100 [Botryotinia calthae]|uniref:Uncharacterized protein n=1 Tax=Botryotinia calthae TaxID=38488 RepID=A0A4Y8D0P5_9HELO|nr:hypothetical protein BOTCAL_0181g00100 [Botryotinia calthae]